MSERVDTANGRPMRGLEGALVLAETLGARVLPVHFMLDADRCSCGKSECTSPAKHPIGKEWQHTASADEMLIRASFARHPNANVGIATGVGSGIVVLDVDGPIGEATLAALEAKHGALPATVQVRTARGRHLYFAAGTVPIHNRAGKRGRGLGDGLDVRGEGGFVVAPPSVHASGFVYAWVLGHAASDLSSLALLPAWLVTMVTSPAQAVQPLPPPPPRSYVGTRAEKWAAAGLDRELASVANAAVGERNVTLNTASFNVGMLVAGGALDGAEARAALMSAAKSAGLTEFEALKTIMSGMAAGLKKDARTAPTQHRADFTPRTAAAPAPVPIKVNGNGAHASEPPGPDEPTAEPKPSAMNPRYSTSQLFASLPSQRWAVPGLQLGPGRPTLIAGYGASAKTLAVQQLALAVTSGRTVWGKFETSPGTVLHIDYEQTYFATAKRYQRLAAGHGITEAELGNRLQYVEMPRVYLDKRGADEEYLAACDGFDIVIIDALRGAAPNTDENDSQFRSAIDVLTYVSQRTGAAIIVLHHAAKPKEGHTADARTLARGSSAIYDACGCVLNFVAKPGQAARLVTQVKMPAEATGGALDAFELVVEDVLCNGEAAGGVRVVWREPVPVDASEVAEGHYQRDAELMIRAVRKNQGKSSNTIVTKCGIPRARALDVLRALTEEGRIICVPGPNKSKNYRVPEGSSHGD